MKRAPKKFTDSSQSEITPEWREWYRESQLESLDEVMDTVASWGDLPQDRWPDLYDKDVGEGCWVIVVDEPYTELKSRFTVPTPSLWWARPEVSRPGGYNLGTKAYPKTVPGAYRVVIETPGGSLWLFPREYVVCNDPIPLITDPDCTIHSLGGQPAYDEDQMFYLQSRGISSQDAILMMMSQLDMRDWGWVEFPEYARAAFEGVGRTVRLA